MPDTFEITVVEQSFDENVTGASVADDLAAALKAANARHAYEQVLADEDPTGWSKEAHAKAEAGVKAALALVEALGGKKDHYRVTIMGGADHVNVSVQVIDAIVPPADADPEWHS